MSNNARNYHAHGGSEWVVGGKLTFLPGAKIEGAENLSGIPAASEPVLLNVAESDATTVASLREDYNALIAELRKAGLVAEPVSGDAT